MFMFSRLHYNKTLQLIQSAQPAPKYASVARKSLPLQFCRETGRIRLSVGTISNPMTAKVFVEINGSRQEVTKQELFDLAKQGVVQPETRLFWGDQTTTVSTVRGIEFAPPKTADTPKPSIRIADLQRQTEEERLQYEREKAWRKSDSLRESNAVFMVSPEANAQIQEASVSNTQSTSNTDKACGCGCLFVILMIVGFFGNLLMMDDEERPQHNAPARISISAIRLMQAYTDNGVAADKEYKGKILIVSGTIDDIAKDFSGTPYVTLKTNEAFSTVQCLFSRKDESALSLLKKGQAIRIEGKCNGQTLNVILRNCSIK